MHDLNGEDRDIPNLKGFVFNKVFPNTWSTRIFFFSGKNIIKSFLKRFKYPCVSINRNIPLFEKKWSYVVQACRMIAVLMGEENGIKPLNCVGQHLLPEIRPAVDHQIMTSYFHQNRDPKSLIFGILT